MIADDLSGILLPPEGPDVGLRQGVIVAFDQSTGANTVRVAGADLTDLPILSGSESLEYAPGDVVVLLRLKSSFAILGRIVVPGSGTALAPSAVAFGSIGVTAQNFALATSYTTIVSGQLTVPAWANRVLVHATADATVENTTAAQDFVTGRVVIDGTAGGTSFAPVGTAAGVFADRYANIGPSAVREVAVTGGQVIDVEFDIQTSTGAWAADTGNIANLNATAVFRRE